MSSRGHRDGRDIARVVVSERRDVRVVEKRLFHGLFFSCREQGSWEPRTDETPNAGNRVNIEISNVIFFFERVGDWLNAATVGVNC